MSKLNLRQAREKAGVSVEFVAEQLGEIAGVSSKTIYNTETILTKGTKEDIQALVLPLWAPLCLL
jgi:hypothetical protein